MKYSLIQQVKVPTHDILDLIFSNDHNLVSFVSVESWPRFTDHRLVIANVSYQLGDGVDIKESYLLYCEGTRGLILTKLLGLKSK